MDSVIMTTPGGGPRLRSRLRSAANAICARSPKGHIHHTYPKISASSHQSFNSHNGKNSPSACIFANGAVAKALHRSGSFTLGNGKSFVPPNRGAAEAEETPKPGTVPDVTEPTDNGRLCGRLSREALSAWGARVGRRSQRVPAESLQLLFNDLNLYPTKTQVFEMLVCARTCARRPELSLTFGEFCMFAAQLRRHTQKRTLSSKDVSAYCSQISSTTEVKSVPEIRVKRTICPPKNVNENGTIPEAQHPYEVFLGGSCNPTTWRSDVAIPALEKMGITFFNPQVADWSLELIEIEHKAKQSARVLFFVLDADTRATAASVEVAHLAAGPRPLVLVLQPYRRGQRIGGEVVTDQEYLDLSRGQAILQEVAERRALPVFTELGAALRCTELLLRGGGPLRPVASTPTIANHLMKLKKAFREADERKIGNLTSQQTLGALEAFTNIKLSLGRVESLVRSLAATKADPDTDKRSVKADGDSPADSVDFELFCSVLAEIMEDSEYADDSKNSTRSTDSVPNMVNGRQNLTSVAEVSSTNAGSKSNTTYSRRREQDGAGSRSKHRTPEAEAGDGTPSPKETPVNKTSPGSNGKPARKLSVFIPKVMVGSAGGDSALTPQSSRRLEGLAESVRDEFVAMRDVYLGGSCIVRTTWREEKVIPTLERNNLSYYVPAMNDYSRMFSAPPYTPPNGARFTFEGRPGAHKHERSPPHGDGQPGKKPKYCSDGSSSSDTDDCADMPTLRRTQQGPYPLHAGGGNRLSASDFYRIPENASPAPFRGMYDDRQIWGSRVLLFGVTRDTRCLAPMVLAAHCIGLRPKAMVLCVQLLDHPEGLSERAVKDYNRGRLYLIDLAKRENVPVFDNLEDATQCVVQKLHDRDY